MKSAGRSAVWRSSHWLRSAFLAVAISVAAAPAAVAQSDLDTMARRVQALQIELTNRLAAIEQSIRFVTDLVERLQRDQRESAAEIQGLVNEIRFQVAEIKSQLPPGSGFGELGPVADSGQGSLGVIRIPADGTEGDSAEGVPNPQAEQVNALLDAIGGIEPGEGSGEVLSADEQFEAARDLLRDGFLRDAAEGFTTFVESYPDDPRIPDAYYWLGEAQYGMNRFRAAAEAHYKVVQDFAGSQRAPDSLLRMGMIFHRQGNNEAACKALQSLGEAYPDASGRLKARAANEALKAGCEA